MSTPPTTVITGAGLRQENCQNRPLLVDQSTLSRSSGALRNEVAARPRGVHDEMRAECTVPGRPGFTLADRIVTITASCYR